MEGGRTRVDCGVLVAYRDGSHHLMVDGVLVYEGDTVVHVGPAYEGDCDTVVDARRHVVAPGFVSAHTHCSGSPFDKSLQDDVYLKHLWGSTLYDVLMPIRDATTRDMARAATRFSLLELLQSGVTTVTDLTAWGMETKTAAEEAGIRAYIGQYVRSSNWVVDGLDLRYVDLLGDEERSLLESALSLIESCGRDGMVRGFLAPAQVDTCSPRLLREISTLGQDLDVPIQIHAGQSVAEFRNIMRRHDMTPIEFLDSLGFLDERVIIGHSIFLPGHSWLDHSWGDDLQRISSAGAVVAHCPQVFARKGQAMESLGAYLRAGVRIALGLDTSPQSMLLEMRVAATLGKVLGRGAASVTARDVFDAATLGGAAALARPDLGRLAVGSKADFVTYRTGSVAMSPMRDPIKNIVYSALPSDVDTVVVGGSTVLRGGSPTYADQTSIVAEASEAARVLWETFGQHHPRGDDVDTVSAPTYPTWP